MSCQSLPPDITSPERRSPWNAPPVIHADATVCVRRLADDEEGWYLFSQSEELPRADVFEHVWEIFI
jgi:hypothetical protein